jgi:hypothetical protein
MTDNRQDTQAQGSNSADNGIAGNVRQKAVEAYDSARGSVGQVGTKATDAIDEAPLIALAGGIAAGALLAALLPRTRAESDLLRPVGNRLTDTAKAAANAARDAGTQKLQELGLTREAGLDTLKSIVTGAGDAAKASAQAAVSTVKSRD